MRLGQELSQHGWGRIYLSEVRILELVVVRAKLNINRHTPRSDDLRSQPPADALKCDEPIPPESVLTTSTEAGAMVTAHVKSTYRMEEGGLHAWSYRVHFHNEGSVPVQLFTRHWVFVDANGRVEEIKGPGARGHTPVLHPDEKWVYDSGTRIATPSGSMTGWFTFEDRSNGQLFSVPIARLALSRRGTSEVVPCGHATSSKKLPATSVHATKRVIVGAISEVEKKDDDLHKYTFAVDLQVNNLRDTSITVHAIYWEIVTANGRRLEVRNPIARNGGDASGGITLDPGVALRMKSTLPEIDTPTARASGRLSVRFGDQSGVSGVSESGTTANEEPFDQIHEIIIAPLACSRTGDPIEPYEPLSFLDATPF